LPRAQQDLARLLERAALNINKGLTVEEVCQLPDGMSISGEAAAMVYTVDSYLKYAFV